MTDFLKAFRTLCTDIEHGTEAGIGPNRQKKKREKKRKVTNPCDNEAYSFTGQIILKNYAK